MFEVFLFVLIVAMAGSESIHDTSCHGMPIGSRIHGRHES